jgi:hypothetical protein
MTMETQSAIPDARDEMSAAMPATLPGPGRRWLSFWPGRRWDWDDALLVEKEDERAFASSWVPVALIAILVVGLLVRLSAADHLTPQIDEPASVMAAHMVVDRGLPIFPSEIPYFQGATLSYVLAPFVALGVGDLQDLHTMRLLSVLFGLLTVFFTYRLGLLLSREKWVGVVAAGLLALDPISVEWSGRVRMYAPLEMLAVLLAFLFCLAMLEGPTRPRLAGVVVVFWLGVFTHIAIALFGPAMFLVALAVYRRGLLRERRDMLVTLGLCALAPVALFVVNGALGPSDRAVSESVPFLSFVGDHLLSISRLLDPDFASWELLFTGSALIDVMPYIYVGVSCLLAGRYFLTHLALTEERDRRSVGLILALYWMPVILVGLFTNEPQERYLIHVLPLGYVLIALAARELIVRRPSLETMARWQSRIFRGLGVAVLLLTSVHIGSGLRYLTHHTVSDPDYVSAMEYVAARHQPGEQVIIALPPPAYLALGGAQDLLFVPGPFDSKRTERYTRQVAEGEYVDYWAGAPALVSVHQVCQSLTTHPGTWLVVDTDRLRGSWAYGGDMARVMLGLTYQQYSGPGGVVVLRVAPGPARDASAERICRQAAQLPPPWVIQQQQEEQQKRLGK